MTASAAPAPFPTRRVALAWAALSVLITLMNVGNIAASKFPDPDDIMRLVQVRDLLGGQGWFDLHQYRLDPPAGTLMHWSRLVDLPIAAVIALLSPLLGQAGAEQAALLVVPLLTLGVIVWLVARIARDCLDLEALTFACLAVGLAPLLVAQVQPLRIDHHAWQVAAALAALIGLLPSRGERGAMRGAALAGAMVAVGLTISLELLPLAAAFGAVFAVRWLVAPQDTAERWALPTYLAVLVGTLAVLFAATRGLGDMAMHCDVVTPGYLALFALAAAGTAGLASSSVRVPTLIAAGLALTGLVAAGLYLSLSPQCVRGPFAALDPLVREFWFENVAEGRPAWQAPPLLAWPTIAQGLAALAALAWLWRHTEGAARRFWAEYLLVAVVAFATGLLVWRSMAFVGAFSAVPLGWVATCLLQRMRAATGAPAKAALALTLVLVLVPSFPGALAKTLAPPAVASGPDQAQHTAAEACGLPTSAEALDTLAPATLFAPMDIGPSLLVTTRHGVVASSHHRAQAAMRDVIVAFTGPTAQARALIARHHAGYVVLCPELVETRLYAERAPGGFAAELLTGHAPRWLAPVPLAASGGLKVWRVVP